MIAVQLHQFLGREGRPMRIGVARPCQSQRQNGAGRGPDNEVELLVNGAARPSFDLGKDQSRHQPPHTAAVDG
jgi:hypothetical protein